MRIAVAVFVLLIVYICALAFSYGDWRPVPLLTLLAACVASVCGFVFRKY